ncbi:hypothetical protein UA24_20615, partial [Marinomonas sp. BSi20414]|nr:hypothetical protein [Marinomonas sp. BSi20414]
MIKLDLSAFCLDVLVHIKNIEKIWVNIMESKVVDANKKKALDAALSQIERQFGKGAIMKMGDTPREAIPSVSTGSLGLDIALGIGGLPLGRCIE